MILSDDDIRAALASGAISIDPCSNIFEPASYDLRAGSIAINKSGRIDLEDEGSITVGRGETVVIYPQEKIVLDMSHAARFGLVSKLARQGLILLSGPQIDPGWRGYLEVTMTNVGNHSVRVAHGEKFATIEFERLTSPASRSYTGEFQDRPPASSDILNIIQSRNPSFAEFEEELRDLRLKYNIARWLLAVVFAGVLIGLIGAIAKKILDHFFS